MNVPEAADDDEVYHARRHLRSAIGAILLDMPHQWAPASKRGRTLNRGSANSLATLIGGDQHLTDIAQSVLTDHSPADAGSPHMMHRDPVIAACVAAASIHLAWRFSGVEMTTGTASGFAAELRELSDKARKAMDTNKARSGGRAAAARDASELIEPHDNSIASNKSAIRIEIANVAVGRPGLSARAAAVVVRRLLRKAGVPLDIKDAALIKRIVRARKNRDIR